jgi:hypothetical protein
MSLEFLRELNGNNTGRFQFWLNEQKKEPRICWYPSAGEDLRDILYLNPAYSKENPALECEPKSPDIFLHTDYFPHNSSSFLDTKTIFLDDRTSITVKSIEELPRCDLVLDNQIVDFPEGSKATGKVLFLEIEVRSSILGNYSVPLVYAFAENAAFCSSKILRNKGMISHIVHVRYGGGLGGGGQSTGAWLLNILEKVKCEVFITDNHLTGQRGDERAVKLFSALAIEAGNRKFEVIRTINSEAWSNHGDVTWNRIQ